MATQVDPRAHRVLEFWFGEGFETADAVDTRPERRKIWYAGGPEIDAEIIEKFGGDCNALIHGDELDYWQNTANVLDALAGVIVGDQYCRNVFRGTANMYAADHKVLPWAKALVDSGRYKELLPVQRSFILLPFMHSENLEDQEKCIALCTELLTDVQSLPGGEALAGMVGYQVDYAKAHRDIIAKYGRFPHRNALVGRGNTPEEEAGFKDNSIASF